MHIRKTATTVLFAILTGASVAEAQQPDAHAAKSAGAGTTRGSAKATIVLVHGAFADATGWQLLIPILQQDGYKVVAVQNDMASLAGDVETTKRLIDAQSGPIVVVGHSYGGAVITGAAAGNANVKALVYLAAFAPEPGEPVAAFLDKYPVDLGTATVKDAAGYISVDVAKFHAVFAADLPKRETDVMAVTQKPINGATFGQSVSAAAWKTIPSWYVVTQQDHAINPDLERFYAKRIKARTTEIASSHVVFISHPREVAKVIVEAAESSKKVSATPTR
jgi:pimeloyl-ACP methyl ester carboxylesterase